MNCLFQTIDHAAYLSTTPTKNLPPLAKARDERLYSRGSTLIDRRASYAAVLFQFMQVLFGNLRQLCLRQDSFPPAVREGLPLNAGRVSTCSRLSVQAPA